MIEPFSRGEKIQLVRVCRMTNGRRCVLHLLFGARFRTRREEMHIPVFILQYLIK